MRRYKLRLTPGEVHGPNPKPVRFKAKSHADAWLVVQKILCIAGQITLANFHAHGGKLLLCLSLEGKNVKVPVPQ